MAPDAPLTTAAFIRPFPDDYPQDAPILILDEPTSAVDTESERFIREALKRLMEGRTVIVITHHPSTTELAQKVAVMKDGVVVEEGSLKEMREEGSFYRRLAT